MSFQIHLADRSIQFEDIIELNSEQQNNIHELSLKRTQSEWIALEKGIKIHMSHEQRTQVIAFKNGLIAGKNNRDLIKDDTIVFTQHAKERIAVRVSKMSKEAPPSAESILLVIQLVIDSDVVEKEAEWKGFTNLTYTLYHTEYDERFKVTVSFDTFNDEKIRVITVSNDHIHELTASIADNPEMAMKLDEFKRQLGKPKI